MIGSSEFESQAGLGIFLFETTSRPTLWPTQSLIQWITWALSLGIKRPGREADHSLPSSAEVQECVELYLHSPIRLHGVVLISAQGQIYLYLPGVPKFPPTYLPSFLPSNLYYIYGVIIQSGLRDFRITFHKLCSCHDVLK
jgi:hypothetical protein